MLTDTTLKRTACRTGGCTSIGPPFLSRGGGSTKLHLNLGVLSSSVPTDSVLSVLYANSPFWFCQVCFEIAWLDGDDLMMDRNTARQQSWLDP